MNQKHALIVEDETNLVDIFSRVLSMANFNVEIATRGDLALTQLTTITPDLILLDLHLPRVSGKEVLYYIRADQRLAHTKVMLVTADVINAKAISDQADAVLVKPIGIHELLDAINDLFPAT